tara:strand:+ start:5095 stop:5562 length:468 start_codon:yes stop_codon:yes gene_type:complete
MKTVDVSDMFKHLLPELTHTVSRVWDNEPTCNDPLKTTLTQAVCNDLRERMEGGGGLTYVLIDKVEDIDRLPVHHKRYLLDGEEVDEFECENNPDVVIDCWTEYKEEWTKELELEKCHSLVLHFTNGLRYTDEECKKVVSVFNKDDIVKFANKGE